MEARKKMKSLPFSYHGKNISLEIQKCKNIFSKIRGLMFRRRENCTEEIFSSNLVISGKISAEELGSVIN